MESYAKALLIAIPFFVGLVLLEVIYGYFTKNIKYNFVDTISSINSGITNIMKDTLGLGLILISYPFLLKHLAVYHIESNVLVYIVAFVTMDFASYWNHRLSHKVNIFWNQHVIHHSSEEFNLACALRQPISNVIGYFPLFLIPVALVGVPFEVIAILTPVHLFAQFWYHTQHIGKLGWLEYIIVTPSQHRVHHAINEEYIDKNLSAIFCVWDRMFGTFQEELDDVPPIYGILKPARSWNPFIINFQHFWQLCQDAWRTKDWKSKFIIWFMPTGWRPKDVVLKYPISGIKDVYHFKKYKNPGSKSFNLYILFQFIAVASFMIFTFYHFGELSNAQILHSGVLILISIFGISAVMDQEKYSVYFEVARGFLGIGALITLNNYFGLDETWSNGKYFLMLYFLATLLGGMYFGIKFSKLKAAVT